MGVIMDRNYINLFFLVFIAPIGAMDKSIVRFTTNFKDNYPYLVNETLNNEKLNNFAMEQFVFNQQGSIESMNNATKRGAAVHLTVGSHSHNNMSQYEATDIKKDSTIHGKVTVGLDQSPSKGKPKKGILLLGSANITNSVWQHKPGKPGTQFNFESGIQITDNMDIIGQAYTMVKNQSPLKPLQEKNIIKTTPTKISLFGSKDTNLNESLALRFKNAVEKENVKTIVRSMTFNDSEVADQLCHLGKKAEVIVDESALTKNGTPLLQKMHKAGVSVNVFCPQDGSHVKQHAKDIIIESKNQQLYINSTANITTEGDKQRNYQLYIPNNKAIVMAAKKDMKKVKKECISLPKALQLKEEKNKKKKEKVALKKIEAQKEKRKLEKVEAQPIKKQKY